MLLEKFVVDISQPHVHRYILYEIGTRFKDYRAKLYRHYKKVRDLARARQKPYKDIKQEDWNILCDKLESLAWKEKSAKNKVARSKLRFNHRGGPKPFQCHREDSEEMITLKAYHASQGDEKTEEEIMETVLGKRSNYVIGMGYGPKPTRNKGSSSKYSDEYVESLEARLQKHEEEMARTTQEQIQKALEAQSQEFNRKLLEMQQMFLSGGGSSSTSKD
ncbi:uncharacterized protein LOC111013476 [Momordica charantia]|uniref:Uncharacterized protein LOC111013476 n=1 Tax=Momordica charantia TaxID=3673 RepID=A0A6J1CQT5_MOMCH|nr:uncharacterized protein LOC111013476 [Momordica charantia]